MAAQAAPEKFSAYIAMSQIANQPQAAYDRMEFEESERAIEILMTDVQSGTVSLAKEQP